jgi:hypothetical protein
VECIPQGGEAIWVLRAIFVIISLGSFLQSLEDRPLKPAFGLVHAPENQHASSGQDEMGADHPHPESLESAEDIQKVIAYMREIDSKKGAFKFPVTRHGRRWK